MTSTICGRPFEVLEVSLDMLTVDVNTGRPSLYFVGTLTDGSGFVFHLNGDHAEAVKAGIDRAFRCRDGPLYDPTGTART